MSTDNRSPTVRGASLCRSAAGQLNATPSRCALVPSTAATA
ncbi:hypothetical protein ACIBPB_22580 [Micromonospora sp. NPDC049836]